MSILAISEADGPIDSLLMAWEGGDLYLRLSAVGLCVLMLLCGLIVLAWLRYGDVISTVFDARS